MVKQMGKFIKCASESIKINQTIVLRSKSGRSVEVIRSLSTYTGTHDGKMYPKYACRKAIRENL